MERLTVERLGLAGDGIGPGPVYSARTLPGEVVEGRRRGNRIVEPRIVEPSPSRVSAPCPHYRSCGGCALQHAADDFVATWKSDVVRHALAARGIEAEVGRPVTSPPRSRRRATLAGRRTKAGVIAGFHARASSAITAIPGCILLHPDLMSALPALEALTAVAASRKGEIALSITRSESGADVAVRGAKPLPPDDVAEVARLAAEHGIARLAWNEEPAVTLTPPVQIHGRARVVPPPGAFLQATSEGEAALVAFVREATAGAKRVLDLFAGVGTFSLPLAETSEVHAVEGQEDALAALDAAWRDTPGLKRITTEARDLFRRPLLRDELRGFDAVVFDPPRAGCEAQMRSFAEEGPPVVASVSCNPVSFARDAEILMSGGYRLDRVTVVDQFRWSAHVELAARFRRA